MYIDPISDTTNQTRISPKTDVTNANGIVVMTKRLMVAESVLMDSFIIFRNALKELLNVAQMHMQEV